MIISGEGGCQVFKIYGTLFFSQHRTIWGEYSCSSFHPISSKLYEDIGYDGEYRLLLFSAIGQVLKDVDVTL